MGAIISQCVLHVIYGMPAKSRKKVYIFFSENNNVLRELGTGADGYFDILEIDGVWGKELTRHRSELKKKKTNKKLLSLWRAALECNTFSVV